jgi:uncharacterized protein
VLLPDVNVLIYAHREDSHPEHPRFAAWITRLATSPEPFALSVLALVGLVRIVTNHRIFKRPSTLEEAFEHGCTLVTTDSDFSIFPYLRWRHPLAPD